MIERSNGHISVRNLSHRYPDAEVAALDDITLEIAKGTTFGLLGPNGAGKSTLLSILTGIQEVQNGAVLIGGFELPKQSAKIKSISALVPQEYAFYPSLTGCENLKFFAGLYRLTPEQYRDRFAYSVEVCRLQSVLDQRSEQYSGGVKRRLNLAIGLMAAPEILYLDEPTVGIDAVSRGYILEAIAKLKGSGKTIVYTSHYMEEVEALCDELAVIDHGKVIVHDQVAKLLSKGGSQVLQITLERPLSSALREALNQWTPKIDERVITFDVPLASLDDIVKRFEHHGAPIKQLQYGVSRLHDVYLKLLEDRA
jgi:ABC-2 type transport system ATP-binding protein